MMTSSAILRNTARQHEPRVMGRKSHCRGFKPYDDNYSTDVNKVKGPSDPMSMVAGIENPGAMSGELPK
ncbi:hypothetical protein PRIPAC_91398, partial [Pristionchus pacificus]|uniref:Uncharacterized protein n=1 Tax=Pristionchus pacificus TaxID=54126 RepID=A0A2A6CW60_PRIPA